MTMKIQIQSEDVGRGIPNSRYSCPIGLAINRTLPAGYAAVVTDDNVNNFSDEGRLTMPCWTANAVRSFSRSLMLEKSE